MYLTASVRFIPAYWNRIAYCNVPARWTAEIHDGLPEGTFIYSDGCSSREEAVSDLVAQLRARKLTGKLRVMAL